MNDRLAALLKVYPKHSKKKDHKLTIKGEGSESSSEDEIYRECNYASKVQNT